MPPKAVSELTSEDHTPVESDDSASTPALSAEETDADLPMYPTDPTEVAEPAEAAEPAVVGEPADVIVDDDRTDGEVEELILWPEPVPVLEVSRRRRSSSGRSSGSSSGRAQGSSDHRSPKKKRKKSSTRRSTDAHQPRRSRSSAGAAATASTSGTDTGPNQRHRRSTDDITDPVERQKLRRRRQTARVATTAIAVTSALAAAFAPASLTGDPFVDMVERVIFAGVVAFVAAHGHRWSWVVGGLLFLVPARGPALAMVVLALIITAWAATRPHRNKVPGAAIGALLANAALWYTVDLHPALSSAFAVAGATVLVGSGFGHMRSRPRRYVAVPIYGALALVVIGVIGTIAGGLMAASDLTSGTSAARRALTQVENGDTESARASLDSASEHLQRADSVLGPATMAARYVPSLAQHVNALDVSLSESRAITGAADDLLASTDYDKLRYRGRIDVDQLQELAPGARNVNRVLTAASERLDQARSAWLIPPLRDKVDELATKVSEVSEASDLAGDVLEVAPGLFGGNGDRRYLVVFLTPAELRGGGGFVGSYAEMTAVDGRLDLARSGPIKELIYHGEFGDREITGPPDYIRRYGRFDPADYIQDVTYSPNFPSSAEVLAELYPQAGGERVDGVIGIDPAGLAAMLQLTGPVTVEGYDQILTADNAEELLLREQYKKFEAEDPAGGTAPEDGGGFQIDDDKRKDFLAEATGATFEKLTSASLPSPSEVGRVLGPAARGRHLQVWSPLAPEQTLFERLDVESSLDIPEGHDGFEVAQHNAANNKLDAYLRREIDYTARLDPSSGQIRGTLRITMHNDVPLPLSALPLSVWGNRSEAPGGTNVTWLSLFTPHRVTAATIDGMPVDLVAEREVGLNAYDTPFFQIPQGKSVTVEIQLAGEVDLSDGYQLDIFPQPVANPDELNVNVTSTGRALTGPGTKGGAIRFDQDLLEPLSWAIPIG